jgi:N6-adenosine-specific RNA methylase IME4
VTRRSLIPIATVLVADPPWQFGDSLPGPKRGASKIYPCMSTRDLMALRIPPVATDSLLFLWRVAGMQQDALDVCKAWGFEPKAELNWQKLSKGADVRRLKKPVEIPAGLTEVEALDFVLENVVGLHFGMGRYTRADREACIIATRGRAASLIQDHGVRSSFFAPVGEHSAKPDAFYEIVERLAPGPWVEIFARRSRPNWTCIGNELGSTLEVGLLGGRS